jgi:hypothetical protein
MNQPDRAEARTEYRVVGEGGPRGAWEGTPRDDLASVERSAQDLARRNSNVRIERRTVTTTDWEAIADA